MKKCSSCGIEKELSKFYKRKASKDGHRSNCKSCVAIYKKKYNSIHKIEISKYRQTYQPAYWKANQVHL